MTAGEQRWAAGLSRDRQIAEKFSDDTLFASFSRFERALINGLAAAGLVAASEAEDLARQISEFAPDGAAIAEAGIRDGVPVPEYVRQLRAHVAGAAKPMLHHGATSQDLIDTATIEALLSVKPFLRHGSTRCCYSSTNFPADAERMSSRPLPGCNLPSSSMPLTGLPHGGTPCRPCANGYPRSESRPECCNSAAPLAIFRCWETTPRP
jgi:hypothetical protein